MKLQHLQTIQIIVTGCRGHDIMTYRSIQQVFCAAHPTQGLGALSANCVTLQTNGYEGRIDLQRLGQGLEAATHQGRRLDFRALSAKPDH